MARALQLDEEIEYDGGNFRLLEPGIYPFRVKAVSIDYFNGSKSVPPCPRAQLTLVVGEGADASDVIDGILLYEDDNGNPNWKISEFYRSVGYKQHGQRVRMVWDETLVGMTGWLVIENREYVKDGETRKANQVKRYLDPEDAPKAQPVQAAQPQAAYPAAW